MLPRDLSGMPSVGHTIDFGNILNWTMHLSGFDAQFKKRLLDPGEFEDACYELRVAKRHAIAREDVRFVDAAGSQSGGCDLSIFEGGAEVKVEAKRRGIVKLETDHTGYASLIKDLRESFLEAIPCGIEVGAILIGDPSEESFVKTATIAQDRVLKGFRGDCYVSDPGFWLFVKDRPPTPMSVMYNRLLKDAGSGRSSYGRLMPTGPNGSPEYHSSSLGILALPGQSVKGVLNRVNDAASQLGPGSTGIVYVHIEHGQHILETAIISLRLIGGALARKVWGGDRNRRIRALVMSGGPYIRVADESGHLYQKHLYVFAEIPRNTAAFDGTDEADSLIQRVLNSLNS